MKRSPTSRRRARITSGCLLLLVVGGLFTTLWLQIQSSQSDQLSRTATVRAALPYLTAVNGLTTALVVAQSNAANGLVAPTGDVDEAVEVVTRWDNERGELLRTTARWAALRQAVNQVLTEQPTGRGAFDRYDDLIGAAAQLAQTIRASTAVPMVPAGPTLLAILADDLPTVVASTSRATYFASSRPSDPTAATEGLVALAVARQNLATANGALAERLTIAFESETRQIFRSMVTPQLNQLRTASAMLATPTVTLDSAAATEAARVVRVAAGLVADLVSEELDAALATHQATIEGQRMVSASVAIVGILLAMVMLWWLAVPAPGPAEAPAPVPGPAPAPAPMPAAGAAPARPTDLIDSSVPDDPAEAERLALNGYLDGIHRAADEIAGQPRRTR